MVQFDCGISAKILAGYAIKCASYDTFELFFFFWQAVLNCPTRGGPVCVASDANNTGFIFAVCTNNEIRWFDARGYDQVLFPAFLTEIFLHT